MSEKLDIYKLRDELLKVAEKEAKKRPDISKVELKKKLSDYITESRIGERAIRGEARKIVENLVGAVTELAVKVLELYLRTKEEIGKAEPAPKKQAKKTAKKKK